MAMTAGLSCEMEALFPINFGRIVDNETKTIVECSSIQDKELIFAYIMEH